MIKIRFARLITEDGSKAKSETSQWIWGRTKFEIMKRCRRNHKLLPSSTYCLEQGHRVWTNVFRVEDDFEFRTGIYK
jgi:hypothetical protein